MTMLTIHELPDRRYEFLLLRDDPPRHQPWDARWVIDVTPAGRGTVLRIREYGWTGGVVFFFLQRVLASPHDFPEYYLRQLGVALQDDPEVFVARSH